MINSAEICTNVFLFGRTIMNRDMFFKQFVEFGDVFVLSLVGTFSFLDINRCTCSLIMFASHSHIQRVHFCIFFLFLDFSASTLIVIDRLMDIACLDCASC